MGNIDFWGIAKPSPAETLAPRSQLLSDLFDHLNEQGVTYAVMNNYEDLPRTIPSDVDIATEPGFFGTLDETMSQFAARHDAEIVQRIWQGDMNCAYILKVGRGAATDFIHIDFFVGYATTGCPRLIPPEELLAGRRPLRNFYVPGPDVEMVFTVMRRLFKGDWSERHCARVAQLRALTDPSAPRPPYDWLADLVDLACKGDVEALRRRCITDWAAMRRFAAKRLPPRDKVRSAAVQSRRALARLREETGNLSLVVGFGERAEALPLNRLDIVFHRKLVVDAAWLKAQGSRPRALLIARLAILKRRRGLILVDMGSGDPEIERFAGQLARAGLVDQMLVADGAQFLSAFPVSIIVADHPSELIEAIARSQATKTERTLRRGGTQMGWRARAA